MLYKVMLSDDALDTLQSLHSKSKSICKKNLNKLEHPYPGRGPGDKEKN
jgi:mRNA-degrading endonuclease RelE of RelBE toxin-antitoxin system